MEDMCGCTGGKNLLLAAPPVEKTATFEVGDS